MLDPRIYRAGFVAVALAVIVVAFSLTDQQGPLGSALAPDAFNGQTAYATMQKLARNYPDRRPGSAGDEDVASYVAGKFRQYGWSVSTRLFSGRTAIGTRTLENVTAVRAGLSSRPIVVVAHRDALTSPATADLSGTATLLELARVLAGETQHRTIVLVSTSGSAGAAGAAQLARSLGGSVDAVIALGDLAAAHPHPPIVDPWSNGQDVAPPLLRNTVAAAVAAQAQLRAGGTSLAAQAAHLAFPLTLAEQGPFGARGQPAVLLSLSGERETPADEPTSPDRLTGLGRSVLQSVTALDAGPAVPAATSYVLFEGKVLPAWAIRLLVLALMFPVLGATIDGVARARRRGHALARWTVCVLAGAVPFCVAVAVIVGARLANLLDAAPPGPVGSGAVPLHGAGIALLAGVALLLAVSLAFVRPWIVGLALRPSDRELARVGGEGPAAAVLLVMCAAALGIWVLNPLAAALLLPALHLWLWVLDPEVRLRPAVSIALVLIGLVPVVLLILFYAYALALGPGELIWNGVLLLAGGHIGVVTALLWSVELGCLVTVVVLARHSLRQPRREEQPVTVRGPVTYAGPGSLGGTESALRR